MTIHYDVHMSSPYRWDLGDAKRCVCVVCHRHCLHGWIVCRHCSGRAHEPSCAGQEFNVCLDCTTVEL